MPATLTLKNQQNGKRIDLRHLGKVVRAALRDHFSKEEYELGICLVGNRKMSEINETWLQHEGSTDVITFDYTDSADNGVFAGDLFVCVPVAEAQARQFRSTWQQELVRYIVHGLLHLCGHDDHVPAARRAMKKQENSILRKLAVSFDLNRVGGRPRV